MFRSLQGTGHAWRRRLCNAAPRTAKNRGCNQHDRRRPRRSAKNGQFTFSIDVDLAEAIQAAVDAHECPNENWEKEAGDVTLDSATVTVQQGGRTITRTINL